MQLPSRLVIATTNPGKFEDWRVLLAAHGVVATLAEQSLPEVPETPDDLCENARRKALAAVRLLGVPVLADDIGLFIQALQGQPGARLKRWAMDFGGWRVAQAHAAALTGSAVTYSCAVALALPGETVSVVLGETHGRMVQAHGDGPGLEPCVMPDGASMVLSALPVHEQHLHHRDRALRLLLAVPTSTP